MRTRIPITNDQVTAALNDSDGDVKDAADRLGVSERTLRRRMRDYGIKARVRYEEAA
jgi:DNA-binding NtrC family response regulator